jgi:hypothetical protein
MSSLLNYLQDDASRSARVLAICLVLIGLHFSVRLVRRVGASLVFPEGSDDSRPDRIDARSGDPLPGETALEPHPVQGGARAWPWRSSRRRIS